MYRIINSTEHNRKKVDLKNLILKYDVIHDALKVTFNKNSHNLRNFGDMGTDRNLAKN
jgi:hypothetical protein